MVTSIVLTGTHSIGLDRYNRFEIGKNKVSIKNVPFVRYRFNKYGEDEIEYIKKMKETFKYSSHLAEVIIDENTSNTIQRLEEEDDNLIIFVYLDINDNDVANGLTDIKIEHIKSIKDDFFDRFLLKDSSSTLDAMTANRIKREICDLLELENSEVGVCQSPLSFTGGNACLTALKARELSAEYAESDEVALPTANHENMNTCGCIKYFKIDRDIQAPQSKRGSKSKDRKSVNKDDGEKKKAKKVKKAKNRGFKRWV